MRPCNEGESEWKTELARPRTDEIQAPLLALLQGKTPDEARACILAFMKDGEGPPLLSAAQVAESEAQRHFSLGSRKEGESWFEVAETLLRFHASCATSGGEGMARMAHLTTLKARVQKQGWR